MGFIRNENLKELVKSTIIPYNLASDSNQRFNFKSLGEEIKKIEKEIE